MANKLIIYCIDPAVMAMHYKAPPPDRCFVLHVFPPGYSLNPGDAIGARRAVERDITKQEEEDLLSRKIAIDKTNPKGPFLNIDVDDQKKASLDEGE